MRATGYYWVKFDWTPYRRSDNRWEPASFDASVSGWAMIGSREVIPATREREVFNEIDETPIRRPTMSEDKWIVAYGNVVDGFEFEGPFETETAALDHGKNNSDDYATWAVARLLEPSKK